MASAANWALLVLASLAAVFSALYVCRSPWRSNVIGRIYAAKSVVLTLVLIQITVSVLVSLDYPGRQPIRLAIYTAGALVYLPMIRSLLSHQQADRRARREGGR